MEQKVLSYRTPPFPTVCLNCGSWLGRHDACPQCGFFPPEELRAFYGQCLSVEKQLVDWVLSQPLKDKWFRAVNRGIPHGWGTDILAIISAIVLGVLSNASYDVIKTWVLSRRKEYYEEYNVWDYEEVVEMLVKYLMENPHLVKSFDFENEDIRIRFREKITPIFQTLDEKIKDKKMLP